ncbi:hypothetical protein FRX31_010349 [Thalictrum thalictroides]|uniref:Uncharacterized protein n=1 Tax=Thalictrum thalictroides TaxID=46969 RepID=A0A7J6WRR2_THATH|nr:hypothetical protein FRX31_010349 [Thalictrum thalictroides]
MRNGKMMQQTNALNREYNQKVGREYSRSNQRLGADVIAIQQNLCWGLLTVDGTVKGRPAENCPPLSKIDKKATSKKISKWEGNILFPDDD